ncbi:MAG: CBS domain-containing protein [Chloroflexota bacterium]|nr:CBS domain-containing protein [Chloroflexota bacterium]
MKVITSHERADMDALASIYGAALLYPDHQAVLPQKLNRNLREFLTLYGEEFPFVHRRELAGDEISHLILVDTQRIAPLPGMTSETPRHIIDHHRKEVEATDSVTLELEMVGATVTLLAEKIREQGAPLGRLGASLLLMGLYEDTGSLSYTMATARDARAAAWILEQGADLALVNQFLHLPLSKGQREALDALVSNTEIHTVRGRTVCVSTVQLDEYVDELAALIHQLIDMYDPDACFLLAQYDESTQIIARSSTEAVDVSALMEEFGGGGHSRAAAALVQGRDLHDVSQALLSAIEERVEPPALVGTLMSTNVHTLDMDMSVQDAAQMMRRYGHEGFPVVEGHQLVGVLTRSDVDRALHHRLGDMPVRNILHTGPLHVKPQDPVSKVQRIMVDHGLGQVPVVEGGRFVGIVTRTDLINLWTPAEHPSRADDIRRMMEEVLPQGLSELLIEARDVANDFGYSLYIVGGFVRDLLLGSPTFDLDLVVEGNAIHMADELAARVGGYVRSHRRFGTAKVILEGERPKGVPPSLDFVTARTEFYEQPSVLPQVERSSIRQDLYRRDFTINTLAICLDRGRYGELLDYYGGERDIQEKRIRVLHNLSFIEDATRILRAVRFEQRLGFGIEQRTAELMEDALELLDDVTGDRLRHELYLILQEAEPERILARLHRLGALGRLHPALCFSSSMFELFQRLRETFYEWSPASEKPERPSGPMFVAETEEAEGPALHLCYLALLVSSMSAEDLESFVERLHIAGDEARFLYEVARLQESMQQLTAKAMLPSVIYRLLDPFSSEARFVLSVLTDSELVRQRLDLYERELSKVSTRIDGYYIRSLGVPPGPVYGEILDRVQDALLDGRISTVEEEQELARSLVDALHGSDSSA